MRTRRWLAIVPILLLLGAACGDDSDTGASPAPAEDGVVQVRAGVNDGSDMTVAVIEFLPERFSVVSGSTVRWTVAGPEPHSVTFFPRGQKPPTPDQAGEFFRPTPHEGPYDGTKLANSGLGPTSRDPMTFELEFEEPGNYPFVCVIHPLMTGTVNVVAEEQDADTQDEINARANDELGRWLAEGRAAKKALTEKAVRKTTEGGKTTWWVEMGATTEHTDVLAFAPTPTEIAAGDDVVFINNSQAPHTATFANGNDVPSDPESDEAMKPAPGPAPQTLNKTTFFNTGWLPPNAPPGGAPPEAARSYRYSVPEAGDYSFVCILHVPSGMAGSIKAT